MKLETHYTDDAYGAQFSFATILMSRCHNRTTLSISLLPHLLIHTNIGQSYY